MLVKAKAFRDWWNSTHGKSKPAGTSHKHEELIYQAWSAGWDNAMSTVQNKSSNSQSPNNEGRVF